MTKALTGLSVKDFLTLDSGYTSSTGTWHGYAITLKELMQGKMIGSAAQNVTFMNAASKNLQANGFGAISTIVGYRVAEKLIRGIGINRQMNKAIRAAGLGNMVKF